jgi:hypothetical protein
MAKQQKRRSISVAAKTYQRIANAIAAGKLEGSVSGYVEKLIDDDMRKRDVPVPEKVDPPKPKPAESGEDIISQHFSF